MEVLRNVVGVSPSEEGDAHLSKRVDKEYGGFGLAPKFSQPGTSVFHDVMVM